MSMENLKKSFDRDGFLILENFFSLEEVDKLVRATFHKISQRPSDVIVDNMVTGERSRLSLTPQIQFSTDRFKVNDLHLNTSEIRGAALDVRLTSILRVLLQDSPILCNGLYFEKGSAQPPHVDSLYMTPKSQGNLIAVWMALENSHPDAGQLEYFPRSHLIQQMTFSNGSYHSIPEEIPGWSSYILGEVDRLGLTKKRFEAKIGDVFIWHAHLLHGGSVISDPNRTRKSLVFHYYSMNDCRQEKLASHNGGFWIDRPPQEARMTDDLYDSFSESCYLFLYPDVESAVQAGQFDSAWDHYFLCGRHEHRLASFPEETYLLSNPDVANAVMNGDFASGMDHFRSFGRFEGRQLK